MITNKKTLLLLDKDNDRFAIESSGYSVDVKKVYKKVPFVIRAARRLHEKIKLPLYFIWFEDWRQNLETYDIVIIHASVSKLPVVEYIHKKYPHIRIIVWYWNPVATTVNPDIFPDEYCEKWSFDPEDCIKYGMKYNTQFYFKNITVEQAKIKYDVAFVGKDKGRLEQLIDLEDQFTKLGINCKFLIMPNRQDKKVNNSRYTPYMSYDNLLKVVGSSKVILDIADNRQSGLTLRPLEAMFLKKKLITNQVQITNLDFYDSHNIFILGRDDIKKLPSFIETPFREIHSETIDEYDFGKWLERFDGPSA